VLACLLMPWADDRFLIGLPAAVLLTQLPPNAEKQPSHRCPPATELVAAIGIPIALFLMLRLVIERYCALNTFGSHPYPPILTHLSAYLFGLTCALRAVWLLVPVGLWLAWRQRPAIGIPLALVTCVSIAAASGLAYDVSRSGVVVIPLILWTIAAWPQAGFLQATEFNGAVPSSRLWFFQYGGACALWAIAAANLCLPAYHHTLNWSCRIRPLWTELRLLDHPPPRYDPMSYANAAVAQLDKGDPSAAAWLVAIAESLGCEKHVVETIRHRVRLAPPARTTGTPGDGSKKSP